VGCYKEILGKRELLPVVSALGPVFTGTGLPL